MIPLINLKSDGIHYELNPSALNELLENNVTMPDIKNVVYNLKLDEYAHDKDGNIVLDDNGCKVKIRLEKPILTTIVFFVDNTKSVVQNSANDEVHLVNYILSNGSTVTTADDMSKERGLIYAILKRCVSQIDQSGYASGSSLGNILRKLVKNAYDPRITAAENKIKTAKRLREEASNDKKPKAKRHSISETLSRINNLLDKVDGNSEDLKKTGMVKLIDKIAFSLGS